MNIIYSILDIDESIKSFQERRRELIADIDRQDDITALILHEYLNVTMKSKREMGFCLSEYHQFYKRADKVENRIKELIPEASINRYHRSSYEDDSVWLIDVKW